MMKIYADNAATTPLSKNAKESMLLAMDNYFANPSSLHTLGQQANEALQNARTKIAGLIGCLPQEIYFTSGGTEADNQAIFTAASIGEKKGKKHIISTTIEHHAVLHTLEKLKKHGFDITLIPVDANGLVNPQDIKNAITESTVLVTVMYANNEIGTIQPIDEIAKICSQANVIFHTDAVQAVGHITIDVAKQGIDMLSFSAHKFNGPKGVGVLYCKKGIPVYTLLNGGAQEKGKRGGTENLPAIISMATALQDAVQSIDKQNRCIIPLRNRLIEGLGKIEHSRLNGAFESRLANNVSFCFEGIEGEALLLMLDLKGIMASSGSACTSGSLDPSHVLLAIGLPHEIAHGSLRLTLSEQNTTEEIDYIIEATTEVVQKLREMSPIWDALLKGEKEYVIQ